ncbi:hypothetical protein [Polynucleobacter sp. Adler-ghost]|uniref:beta strand repeat-containing protein n=1 Tax=Polynucleobacter sp. Adler-ghost TaxID=2770234 RepID=UPI001BFE857A|nr:hypothetical protein [Polynucleobacter sp. Adler-ghost]QWE31200.1 hypothetical protein ICV89_02450 [Polynucleobacter sp. Adler-ghost]
MGNLAIKIGAGSRTFDDIALAYSMRGNQKLSITGAGTDLYAALGQLTAKADGIGSIKATSDIVVTAAEVTQNKAALLKLGTRSLVLQNAGVETNTEVSANFNSLDSVYTKFKSLNISAAPTIDVAKLSTAVNLGAMEVLSGKTFNVSGSATDIQNNISSLLKNISKVGSITVSAGQELQLNVDQLAILGDKLLKSAGSSVTAIAGSSSTVVNATAHGLNTGDAVQANTTRGAVAAGTTYYARSLSSGTFALYDTQAHANDTNYTTGIVNTGTVAASDVFTKSKSTVALKDTADNLLTTSGLALINKFNNTNINAPSTQVTATGLSQSAGVLTSTSLVGFNTGDAVAYNGGDVASGSGRLALADGQLAYARKLSDNSFALYDSYLNAVTTSSTAGLLNTGATSTAVGATYSSQVGNSPLRVTTLDNVQVKAASLAQLDQFTTLTSLTSTNQGSNTRALSNIVSSVEVADTLSKLQANGETKTGTVTSGAASDSTGIIALNTHGYASGDAVTFATTGTKAATGLTSGNVYYVGKLDAGRFVLYDNKADAVALDVSTSEAAGYLAKPWKAITAQSGAGTLTFSRSALENSMKAVTSYKDGTGSISRVTIKGSGAITSTDLQSITSKVLRTNANANVTYSAKAVDIQNNLQAIYDNKTVSGNNPLTEIVVTDGTAMGKKGFSMSQTFYTALKSIFANGVDNPAGKTTNKNYSFTISSASFDSGNPTTLQDDVNVSTYAITNASYSDLDPIAHPDYLRIALGQSKLKSLTTQSISDSTQRNVIKNLLNAIGNPVDRAKLKLIG